MDILDSLNNWMFGTADEAYSEAKSRQTDIENEYEKNIKGIANQYQNIAGAANQKDLLSDYISGLQGTDFTASNIDASKYAGDYSGKDTLASVSDYLDPSMDYSINAANKAIEGSAAGKGGLFSGATGQAISDNTSDMANKYWSDAYNRANAANMQEDATKNVNFNQALGAGQFNVGNQASNLAGLGKAYEASMDPMDTYSQMMSDMYGTKFGSQTNLNMGGMQNQMADRGLIGSAGDFVGRALSSWIGS